MLQTNPICIDLSGTSTADDGWIGISSDFADSVVNNMPFVGSRKVFVVELLRELLLHLSLRD